VLKERGRSKAAEEILTTAFDELGTAQTSVQRA
jgi:hypothetical protein